MKVLHMCPSLDGGGIERLLLNYYLNIDKSKIQFDFTKSTSEKGILEDCLTDMGCKIFLMPQLKKGYKAYKRKLTEILKNNNYDIIHCHGGFHSVLALKIAKKYKIKVRIAHSHTAQIPESFISKLIRKVTTFFTKRYSTHLFACGKKAGEWMWGKDKFYILKNAINLKKFNYDVEEREKIRKELGILDDEIAIGMIGRLSIEKNHKFMIDVFSEIEKVNKKYKLFFIGGGPLEEKLSIYSKEKGLNDKINFMGVRNDVNNLMNFMDIFVLPSLYEGLPVTLIEVQAFGLTSLVSTNITNEISFNSNVEYVNNDMILWKEKLLNIKINREKNGSRILERNGYEITSASKKLLEYYFYILEKENEKIL